MRGITHAAAGYCVGATLLPVGHLLGIDLSITPCLLSAFGALLPDIDTPSSVLGRRVWPISLFLTHRGFLHSYTVGVLILVGGILASFFWGVINGIFIISIALGYLSHIFLDSLTPMGIGGRSGPIRTGSLLEFLILIGLLVLVSFITLLVWGQEFKRW